MKFKSCDQVFTIGQFGDNEVELTVQLDSSKAVFIAHLRIDGKLRLNSKFEVIYPQDPVAPDSIQDACGLKVGHVDGTICKMATGDFADIDYIEALHAYYASLSVLAITLGNGKTINKLRSVRYSLNKALEYIIGILGETI